MPAAVQLLNVSRRFGSVQAVSNLSIEIAEGEFFSLLGPSGSGKTTCLRLIAGFEQPDSGSIRIHGVEAAGLPPYRRDVNTVFQDYALFPHMNVRDNVAYGLKVRGVDKAERYKQAEEALEMVALEGFGARKPSQMSGGQRQRVALARALINRPRVLLLDEPLGALDLKLREQMQGELKKLQRQLGITFVFVTHDQGEALSMSDRVAVFNQGRIEQVDTPRALYQQPATAFVAEFVGTSNLLRGELAQQLTGRRAPFAIRPEYLELADSSPLPDDYLQLSGSLQGIQYQGASTRYEVLLPSGQVFTVTRASGQEGSEPLQLGQPLTLRWPRRLMVALREEASR
ncbi:polyamine ABC transporter ATP-binding protein [Ventosimonas gracilis]|uniref:Polyamine ABC transporter ATP-binding protein n=1 Tax=Ventosimonas gracilis TaxID=1680762 RepID=A0A139SV18_9GAMM|nr:ABC transporter ATP-binding protein [Ventosimonas gracilis]KXU38419.1 polyamine ABC transporter ATP-binding protein [Ventosimonas gracilis]